MPIASTLPPEVLLMAFEKAVDYMPGFIDPDALHRAYQRNATLTACALVCKSWAAPAQRTLFRDITLGVATNNLDEAELVHKVYYERPGSTTPALASLVRTLEKFRDTGSTIPRSIRAVHFCIGETDTWNYNSDLGIDYIIHGSPAAAFRAIALCPGIVHLNITLGVYPGDPRRFVRGQEDSAAPMFSAEDIAILKAIAVDLPNLRQLSIQMPNNSDFIRSFGYRFTSHEAANAIIAALCDRITLLDVSIDARGEYLLNSEAGASPFLAFPILHTFRSEGDTHNIRTAVLHHAPRLRRALLPSYYDLAQAKQVAPDFIRVLGIATLHKGDDLASFSQLEVLEVIRSGTDLPVLHTLPRTLRELALPAKFFEIDNLAQTIADAVRELPNLQSIKAMQSPSESAPAVVQQLCHLPVDVVPWAASGTVADLMRGLKASW